MVAYDFQHRFAEKIVAGTKTHTMRKPRKRNARPGDTLQLYTGLRTPRCRLIGKAVCTRVSPVVLDFFEDEIILGTQLARVTSADALDNFARADGFADWPDLRRWFVDIYDTPASWSGMLIEWGDFRPAGGAR
jgi:hypothetical protein